ncbi:MAG: hypothetical protein JW838_04700 [Spirochaetes bacterium]|nr:hypothetical protein [Spirochaetota bacterium]
MPLIRTLILTLALVITPAFVSFPPASVPIHIHTMGPAAANTIDAAAVGEPAGHSMALYHVMGIILLVWFGIALYLFVLNRKVSSIERDLRSLRKSEGEKQ